ncbi:MAG: hypothetical protein U5M51_09390 [Emticicia sp.]|nr:hypothetical protein [Emticicia sp.]
MTNRLGEKTLQILDWAFCIIMKGTNSLAYALPNNGKNTGQLSEQYPNLFVPAGITFSIWGIIYLLLLIFCVQQSKNFFGQTSDSSTNALVDKIGLRFTGSCILNSSRILFFAL